MKFLLAFNAVRHARSFAAISALLLAGSLSSPAPAQPPPPVVAPAMDGIFAAFDSYPLVGIGDAHGLAQELDFYAALVRDPRFAQKVGNVVVEFGGARHQGVIDRYVAGEEVPYTELRQVWTDTAGWIPYPSFIGFQNFYAQVRATNLGLPPDQRIKVWLGEPPIDWSKVTSRAEHEPFLRQRDSHAAEVILKNILGPNRKALVIYGGAHFTREKPKGVTPRTTPLPGSEAALRNFLAGLARGSMDESTLTPNMAAAVRGDLPTAAADMARRGAVRAVTFKEGDAYAQGDIFEVDFDGKVERVALMLDGAGKISGFFFRGGDRPQMLVDLVEAKRPNAFYIVAPYFGFSAQPCEAQFEQAFSGWPRPALATQLRGSSLAAGSGPPACQLGPSILFSDAMLYLGPGPTLVASPRSPDIYLDEAFRREISRRNEIMTGRPLGPLSLVGYTAMPLPFRRTPPAPPAPSEEQRMAAFRTNDRNADGKLDKDEYRALLETLGFAAQFDSYLAQRDANKDGFISADEYRPAIQ